MALPTVALTYDSSAPDEDLTPYVFVENGVTVKRGKQEAFGLTEMTTCQFVADRSILKSAAWRNQFVTRDGVIKLTVNGSVRFAGWWWRFDEDIFDERGQITITLASSYLRAIVEDTRSLRYSTRAIPFCDPLGFGTDLYAYLPVDPGLTSLDRIVDSTTGFPVATYVVSEDPTGQPVVQDPPSSITQSRAGGRCTYAKDGRLAARLTTAKALPATVLFVMNAPPSNIAGAQPGTFFDAVFDRLKVRIGITNSGNVWLVILDLVTNLALTNASVDWATPRDSGAGELWLFGIGVSESGGNVTVDTRVWPISRFEGNLANVLGTQIDVTVAASPAGGVGNLIRLAWGPSVPGLFEPEDLLLSDIAVVDEVDASLIGKDLVKELTGGLRKTGGADSLLVGWGTYFGSSSLSVFNATYTWDSPTIPPGTGSEQMAAIEEAARGLIRDTRGGESLSLITADWPLEHSTELALGDDYLRGLGSAGTVGELEVLVPDVNYPIGVTPAGADWQRNRSRRWARLPVLLDSSDKRSVDVGTGLVSFYTRPGNLWRGRVVGIEETVTAALHTAYWVLEEWPHAGQMTVGDWRLRAADGTAKAASVGATYSGGGSLTVDTTYAYSTPFTVRPNAASRYKLVISGISGTTWTINTGASTLPPSLAVGDVLDFENAAVAF